MGDAFVVVTPGRNWFYLCNAEALTDVFQRRSDSSRPLEIFGGRPSSTFIVMPANGSRNGQCVWTQSIDGEYENREPVHWIDR